jgi:hypothetical protein
MQYLDLMDTVDVSKGLGLTREACETLSTYRERVIDTATQLWGTKFTMEVCWASKIYSNTSSESISVFKIEDIVADFVQWIDAVANHYDLTTDETSEQLMSLFFIINWWRDNEIERHLSLLRELLSTNLSHERSLILNSQGALQ